MMRVYIASSFRQFHAVQALRDLLVLDGHYVVDWTEKAPPLPAGLPALERRKAFDSDVRGRFYDFCAEACGRFSRDLGADAVVYFGPAGQNAACETGMAAASGILTLGIAGALEQPGLILSRAVQIWCVNIHELRAMLKQCAVNGVRQQLKEYSHGRV